MIPVTAWTRKVKQPRGGYLPVKSMSVQHFDDGRELNPDENLGAGTIGTSVDYLSRVLSGKNPHEVFRLPLAGADKLDKNYIASKYLAEIIMFADDGDICPELIRAGVNLSRFDIAFKASNAKYFGALNGEVAIDDATMENISIMLERILVFRRRHDMMSADSAYLHYKSFPGLTGADCLSGEIDILSSSGVWDCKAMTTKLRATYTLQLLAYYIMLQYSHQHDMACVCESRLYNPMDANSQDFTLGFFNPRENTEYSILVSSLDESIFYALEQDMVNTSYMY